MTPAERAHRAILESDMEECIAAAVQAEKNAGELRLDDAKQALQAALEDLARVTKERDGLAEALGDFRKELDNESDIDDEGRPNVHMKLLMVLDALHKDKLRILAAHDRQVAARVLREAEGYVVEPIECSTLLRLADQYERGEREVPSE